MNKEVYRKNIVTGVNGEAVISVVGEVEVQETGGLYEDTPSVRISVLEDGKTLHAVFIDLEELEKILDKAKEALAR